MMWQNDKQKIDRLIPRCNFHQGDLLRTTHHSCNRKIGAWLWGIHLAGSDKYKWPFIIIPPTPSNDRTLTCWSSYVICHRGDLHKKTIHKEYDITFAGRSPISRWWWPLVHWTIGSLVHWSIGPLVHWSKRPFELTSGVPLVIFRCASISWTYIV